MKNLLHNSVLQWLICKLMHGYCWFCHLTSKNHYQNKNLLLEHITNDEPMIIAIWHGRLLFAPFLPGKKLNQNIHTIISRHNDGELITKLIRMFHLNPVRGSTNRASNSSKGSKDRGGVIVLKESLRILKQGKVIAYTPDGPRGPRMRIEEVGILKLASHTQAKIIPLTISASNATFFKSWDRFMLPHPFGRISYIVGEPIIIEKDCSNEDLEKTRKELENRLNTITQQADEQMRVTLVKPA